MGIYDEVIKSLYEGLRQHRLSNAQLEGSKSEHGHVGDTLGLSAATGYKSVLDPRLHDELRNKFMAGFYDSVSGSFHPNEQVDRRGGNLMQRREVQTETYYTLVDGSMFYVLDYDQAKRLFRGTVFNEVDYYSRKAVVSEEEATVSPADIVGATSVAAWELKMCEAIEVDPLKDAIKAVILDWNSTGEVERNTVQDLADLVRMDIY